MSIPFLPIPVFFLCFIVFIFWFRVKSKQNANISSWDEEFWKKEREANFARKQDISNLEYLELDKRRLPFSENGSEEEQDIQNELNGILLHQTLNLGNMSNADIKLKYGLANFEKLSACDQNFTRLIRTLNKWGVYCFETENYEHAKQIFEYAIELGSDVSSTYLTLARIYLREDSIDKIQSLIDRIDATDSFMKESIKTKLMQILREY